MGWNVTISHEVKFCRVGPHEAPWGKAICPIIWDGGEGPIPWPSPTPPDPISTSLRFLFFPLFLSFFCVWLFFSLYLFIL